MAHIHLAVYAAAEPLAVPAETHKLSFAREEHGRYRTAPATFRLMHRANDDRLTRLNTCLAAISSHEIGEITRVRTWHAVCLPDSDFALCDD